MGIFHRLRQAMSTRLESFVDEIENQESVALATVQEMEHAVARVRLQRRRIERRAARLEQRASDLESAMALHREHALRDKRDRALALESVRRLLETEKLHKTVLDELHGATSLRDKVRDDERSLEGRLEELRQRCIALSTRHSSIYVREGIEGVESVDDAFDRWEARIEEREALAEAEAHSTGMHIGLEETAETEQRLDEILAEEDAS